MPDSAAVLVAALHLAHVRSNVCCFPVEAPHLATEKLYRLLCRSTGILAPDLSTVVEDTGRQRVYGCDMVLSHSAFLLIWWIKILVS